jgi:hypothetical protein
LPGTATLVSALQRRLRHDSRAAHDGQFFHQQQVSIAKEINLWQYQNEKQLRLLF